MKKRVVQGFQEMSNKGLRLNLTRKDALIDFLSCLPETLTKTSTRSKIVPGFVSNGQIGDEAKYASKFAFPDFDIMLDTVRREVSKEEYNLCKKTFPELLLYGLKLGEVEEQEYNRLGYPMDEDPCGQEVSKDKITIKQECRQRAKCLSKDYQIEQRHAIVGRHCQVRIKYEKKRDHWSVMWAGKCLPQLSAIMVLFGHVKNDITCLDLNACLLADPSAFKKATTPTGKMMEGCYLYYDTNDGQWIRSGKAVGSNFDKRHKEHSKGSELKDSISQKSKFYSSYPSRSVNLHDNRARKGTFENLQQYIGVGYNKMLKKNMLKDVKDKGIFILIMRSTEGLMPLTSKERADLIQNNAT